MKDVFKKTFYLVKLLARENERVQLHLFDRIDDILDVRIVESDLAIALKEVIHLKTNNSAIQGGEHNVCHSIHISCLVAFDADYEFFFILSIIYIL